jgi:hypothetical protein
VDTGYVSALAALAGSSIGAFASLATTWLNQSYQSKIQRRSNERAHREQLFGDFINEAASVYSDAMVNKLDDPAGIVNLYALKNRLALLSNEDIVNEAEKVLQTIMDRYHGPKIKFSESDPETQRQFDLLRDFTKSCKREMTGY